MQERQQHTRPESAIQIFSTKPRLEELIHTAIRIPAQRGEIRSTRRGSGNAQADARGAGGHSRRRGLGRQRGGYRRTDPGLAGCPENERKQESNAGISPSCQDIVRTHSSPINPVETGMSGCSSRRKERVWISSPWWRWTVIRNLGGRGKIRQSKTHVNVKATPPKLHNSVWQQLPIQTTSSQSPPQTGLKVYPPTIR